MAYESDITMINAEHEGKNEYFLTPEKHIIEVGRDTDPFDPRDEYDMASHIIDAYNDWKKIDKEYNNALLEHVPDEVQEQAYVDYLKDNYVMVKVDDPDRWADFDIVAKGNRFEDILQVSSEYDGVSYTGDIQKDAEAIVSNNLSDLEEAVSLYELEEEKEGLFSDYVIFAEHEHSSVDRYTEWGAYFIVSDVEKEFGDKSPESIEKAKNLMQSEMKDFGAYVDGDAYSLAEYSNDGSMVEETCFGFLGDESIIGELPEGTVSLGLYGDIEDCFEKNQEVLGITIDPLPSLEDRIHIAEDIGKKQDALGLNAPIKEWYCETFPDDSLGSNLNPDVSFKDVVTALNDNKDIYKALGAGDSFVRENVFWELSDRLGVEYDKVYNTWMGDDKLELPVGNKNKTDMEL